MLDILLSSLAIAGVPKRKKSNYKKDAWLLLGNILHVCLMWFSG